ncbi:OB-fold protein [Clostridium sp. FP1]|uniref:OB-fold protein n=1 Tax=Clostridium sp. FP1 TaxID=2724076 RepID=UPI0013E94806|nr:hypothetical protein [Clostridium sp. FP1]MBZ9636275.1 OB-fold putative lipoprotein [Clostridium sp. FP1]
MSKMVNCKACNKEIAKGASKCVHCGKDQRNFFQKHKVLTVVLALVIVGGIGSAVGGGKDTATTAPAKTTSTTPAKTTEKPAEKKVEVLKVTTTVLGKAYEENEVKADKTYKGKTVETSGKITDISVVLGNTTLNLSTGADFDLGILCSFKEQADIDKIGNLKKGDTVTVQGVVDGKSLGVSMGDCILK